MKKFKVIKCVYEGCGVNCRSGKRGLCPHHYGLLMKGKAAAKQKAKKAEGTVKVTKKSIESQRKRITKKLDILFSKLVKTIYPLTCHGKCDGRHMKREETQCCHFVGRRKVLLRWFLGNALPGCAQCNLAEQDHVYFLGKYLNKYYGEGFAEDVSNAGKRTSVKLDVFQMEEMYQVFSKALDYLKSIEHLSKKEQDAIKSELRTEIISKTRFF